MMTPISRHVFLVLGAALAFTTCAPQALLADDPDDSFDWTLHEPEKVGMTGAGLDKVRAAIQKNIDNKVIPGAVTAIVRHNKLVWYEAQGVRDAKSEAKMGKDDLFRMMSSSKPVTAVAVLMMMDQGKLSLDDKVS